MFKLICTSYNETEQGLVFRKFWIEEHVTDSNLKELIEKWGLPNDFEYPSKGSLSKMLCGKMEIDKVAINIIIECY